MKIKCNREQLLHAFQAVASVAPTRSPKPILQNVKLEVNDGVATFLATDLEIAIRFQLVHESLTVSEPGSAILPTIRFGQVLRECSDEAFLIEASEKNILVKGDRNTFNLAAENPAEFPSVVTFEEAAYYEMSARWIKELIRRTVYATDNESSRYALGGVKMEYEDGRLIGIGTDGRRLAKMEGPVQSVGEVTPFGDATIVPSRSLQLLDRAISEDDGEVHLAIRQNEMLAKSPRAVVYSRLLEGRFPRWRDVFPQRTQSIKIELPVAPFAAAVRQAAIVTSDESRGVNFTFCNGTLELAGHAAEVGESDINLPIAYDGNPLTITLDPRYMVDFLKVLDPDKSFTLDLQDGESAAVCTTDDGYGYVIMPLARDR